MRTFAQKLSTVYFGVLYLLCKTRSNYQRYHNPLVPPKAWPANQPDDSLSHLPTTLSHSPSRTFYRHTSLWFHAERKCARLLREIAVRHETYLVKSIPVPETRGNFYRVNNRNSRFTCADINGRLNAITTSRYCYKTQLANLAVRLPLVSSTVLQSRISIPYRKIFRLAEPWSSTVFRGPPTLTTIGSSRTHKSLPAN